MQFGLRSLDAAARVLADVLADRRARRAPGSGGLAERGRPQRVSLRRVVTPRPSAVALVPIATSTVYSPARARPERTWIVCAPGASSVTSLVVIALVVPRLSRRTRATAAPAGAAKRAVMPRRRACPSRIRRATRRLLTARSLARATGGAWTTGAGAALTAGAGAGAVTGAAAG